MSEDQGHSGAIRESQGKWIGGKNRGRRGGAMGLRAKLKKIFSKAISFTLTGSL